MPFLRSRLIESARSESSMALLCIQMAFCSESMRAVSGSCARALSAAASRAESPVSRVLSATRLLRVVSMAFRSRAFATVSVCRAVVSASAPASWRGEKRANGTSAMTNIMTKSSRNMSVFLLTAAKIRFLCEI